MCYKLNLIVSFKFPPSISTNPKYHSVHIHSVSLDLRCYVRESVCKYQGRMIFPEHGEQISYSGISHGVRPVVETQKVTCPSRCQHQKLHGSQNYVDADRMHRPWKKTTLGGSTPGTPDVSRGIYDITFEILRASAWSTRIVSTPPTLKLKPRSRGSPDLPRSSTYVG